MELPPLPASVLNFESLRVSLAASVGSGCVVEVTLARPLKLNALGAAFWREFPQCMHALDQWSACRCILLTADGPAFSVGLDLEFAASLYTSALDGSPGATPPKPPVSDPGRIALKLFPLVRRLQAAVSSVENVNKPVVAAVSGLCLGGGLDMICACDIRLCSLEAVFSCKEIELAMAPDTGTLQRLPRLVRSSSWAREVCYTGREFDGLEAEREGLVSSCFRDRETLRNAAVSLCTQLATKGPVAVASIKQTLNFSRGRPVEEGLLHQSCCSAAALQTPDVQLSIEQAIAKSQRKHKKKYNGLPFAAL